MPAWATAIGAVDPPEMQAIYDHADIVVAPTCPHGFNFPLLESLIRGVPSITGDGPNERWLVGDAGRSVPPRHIGALVNAIDDVVDHFASYKQAASQRSELLRHRMSWRNVAGRIAELLDAPG
jgi:glycosyltransferase involved in cell wall biosynthesis